MSAKSETARSQVRSWRWVAYVPVVVFAVLGALFFTSLFNRNPSDIPSVLIGKPAPDTTFPALEGLKRGDTPLPGFARPDFRDGTVTLVNVWGSWCGPCRIEHPYLMQLRETHKLRMFGINYKDAPENARRFLGAHGNPYDAVGVDREGRKTIDWGIYGVPETFVVDGEGQIRYKHIGPISQRTIDKVLLPLIAKIKSGRMATQN